MKVALHGRFKNTLLFEAASKLGSQAELARKLGVDQSRFGRWCNLQAWPPVTDEEVASTPGWTIEKRDALEKKLLDITGHLLEDIFPEDLRHSELHKQELRVTKTADIPAYALENNSRHVLPAPDELLEQQESAEAAIGIVSDGLKALSHREREVYRLRRGIGGEPYTLDEVAAIFRVTRERIRQIEFKAEHKLERWIRKNRANELAGVLGNDGNKDLSIGPFNKSDYSAVSDQCNRRFASTAQNGNTLPQL